MSIAAGIFGVSGETLTADEKALFKHIRPFGFILFARNCKSREQIASLVASLKEAAGHTHVPVFIDQEGGRVARLGPPQWRKYPAAKLFADMAALDENAAAHCCYLNARMLARDLAELGINADCAPVADLPVKGAHNIIGDRAFGATPARVVKLARAMANGLHAEGVLSVLKHIPGHGRATVDSHEDLPRVTTPLDELERTDFAPFKTLNDLPMAMTAHVQFAALDDTNVVTLSKPAIRYIREQIKFDGLLMSDDLSMKALKGDFSELTRKVLEAGCDVVLHCNGKMEEMDAIAKVLPALSGNALRRANRVFGLLAAAKPKDFDVAQAEKEVSRALNYSYVA